jgi:catechol 2,3-dioxygenase-like lactoylglutathione lyase family enzyme
MLIDVLALDHLFISVSDFERSQKFYDGVMQALGFYKGTLAIAGEPHAHYFNRVMQYSVRPARSRLGEHDPYAPGVHHVCFQVKDRQAVDEATAALRQLGVDVTDPAEYPEYAPDYYASFFVDPDGIRLEIKARTRMRDDVVREWDRFAVFENPLAELRNRN